MDITVFENGAAFDWKRVRASELNSVFADITDLLEKSEAARIAFKRQSKLNGNKGEKSGHSRRLQPRSRPKSRSKS
jgi:hypothetical protein